ncbi:carboxylesterase family protein [Streptomyces phaeochromogenes]|uniref:carboxylesterase family protein n=1 Tax=Streptomyces phaeochromogenes TaxID=1923 RepID=UPI00369AC8AB
MELSPDDTAAALWVTRQGSGTPPDGGSDGGGSGDDGGGPGAGGPKVGDTTPGGTVVAAKSTLTQSGTVTTTRGTRYAADGTARTTDAVVNLIVDDFRQFSFSDPVTGQTLRYNLFVPKNHDRRKSYPLVLFMHDASVVNVATEGPLIQGLGAVCWASPEDQDRHDSFVLAPEYGSVVIDDNYEPSTLFEATANLVRSVTEEYGIDPDRLYTTGQSMGAMMSLGLNIRYPELFAAAFIVAGQWPASQAAPLAGKKLWILVSADDTKAYPGELRGRGPAPSYRPAPPPAPTWPPGRSPTPSPESATGSCGSPGRPRSFPSAARPGAPVRRLGTRHARRPGTTSDTPLVAVSRRGVSDGLRLAAHRGLPY